MNGGSLARIVNKTENGQVDALADTYEQGRTWIGLTNRESWNPREWIWEGSDMKLADNAFASWHGATGEPVNAGTQQCAVLLEDDWYTAHCNEWLPFVCYKPRWKPANRELQSVENTLEIEITGDPPQPRPAHTKHVCDAPKSPSDLKNW